MVSYKKIDLIIDAFNKMPNKKLIIAGVGPDYELNKNKAKENITLLGYITDEVMVKHMQHAKAFVFAAEEDFGIIPVEAQACGTPVIGYGKGGLLETVIHEQTGILFEEQTAEAIIESIIYFETKKFDPILIHEHAQSFSKERFEKEMKLYVENKYSAFMEVK